MQKNNSGTIILAINPGIRYLALAVFDGAELREWRLKSLKGKGLKSKLEKVKEILADFIERFHPDILALKRLHPSRSSDQLEVLAGAIADSCRRKGMTVYSYSIGELKNVLARSARINKKELTRLLAAAYPELARELKREERNRNAYFIRLFEAVALGHVCLNDLNNNY